jgi:hypothetical protein
MDFLRCIDIAIRKLGYFQLLVGYVAGLHDLLVNFPEPEVE